MLWLVCKAFIIGLLGACSAGPVFVLVMNRAVSRGIVHGFASAFGTAVVEGFYFALALTGVLGLGSPLYTSMFELVSGMILLASGAAMLISDVAPLTVKPASGSVLWSSMSAGFVTASNPFSILFYLGVAAHFFADSATSMSSIICYSISISAGSLLTLTIVSFIASRIGNFFSKRSERILSITTASILCCMAIYLLGHVGYSFWATESFGRL